jgi:hypothetical protein
VRVPARKTKTRGRKAKARSRPRQAVRKPRTARAGSPKRARRVAPKKRRGATPRLRVVKGKRPVRSASRTAALPPAFPQREGASPKQMALFEMIRARAVLLAAVHGLPPAAADQPMGEGKWSVRETVLHLVTRDQARLRESEATLHGQPASWKDVHDPEMGAVNRESMAALLHHGWDDALRLLHRTRELLMEELESVPEEPAEVWSAEHPFGWMLHALPPHDRHHAEVIKRWRATRGI